MKGSGDDGAVGHVARPGRVDPKEAFAIRGAPATLALEVDPRSVRQARVHVQQVLTDADLLDLLDAATLAVSEVVTNAIVHAGTQVELRVYVGQGAARVEVEDRGLQLPSRRAYSDASGTGRGLALVEDTVHRWGVEELADGKVVWFEVGEPDGEDLAYTGPPHEARVKDVVKVRLRHVPLLMHVAWQEHAAALLREFLLYSFGTEHDILAEHARASEAMSLLHAQLPVPQLGAAPDALMAGAIEPYVSADIVVLEVPLTAVAHFVTLDRLLHDGLAEARAGHFLCPPTQPEIEEMRRWLCAEVARQSAGDPVAVPWAARDDAWLGDVDLAGPPTVFAGLADTEEALLATDENSVVVAVSPSALRVLGYDSADDLLGRRVIAVVPDRFCQAHVAGTTLHATNGRDNLLDVPVRVPMLRADGSEVDVELTVSPRAYDDGRRAFVALFEPLGSS